MPEYKTIILVRHGSLDEQYDGCYIGSTDVPLSKRGVREAEEVGLYLKAQGISFIYASPLLRARQTAELILDSAPAAVVVYDDLLREIDFGAWEGRTFDQISMSDPDAAELWADPDESFSFPGGESLISFYARIHRIKQILLDSPQELIVLVTHGGVIRSLICNALDLEMKKSLSFRIDRGSVSALNLFPNSLGILTALNFKPPR